MSYENYPQQGSANQALGAGAPKQLRLDGIAERFEKSLAEFQAFNQRLENIADRILGPVPEAVETGNKAPGAPNAQVSRLESMTEALGYLLRRMRQSTDRLETL